MSIHNEAELKSCPFCGGFLEKQGDWELYEHNANGCVLEGSKIAKSNLDEWNTRQAATEQGDKCQILKGVGKINGDGWKDTTVIGEVVYVWNDEKPKPYKPGQYLRVGNKSGWTASTEQYDFYPATVDEAKEAIESLCATQPPAEQGVGEAEFYYDPKTQTPWDCSFLAADDIDNEDNREHFTVPLYTHPPKPTGGGVPECFQYLYEHAKGLVSGTDWNNGTAAKHHRLRLIDAVGGCATYIATQQPPEQE